MSNQPIGMADKNRRSI